jgi:hypothetical protein
MTRAHAATIAAFLLATSPGAVLAQQGITTLPETVGARPGQLVFFSDANFRGRSFNVTGARNSLTIPFRPRSFQVALGESWQLCANTNFRSPCSQIDRSRPDRGPLTLVNIRSARPVGGGGGGGDFSGSGFAGQSLRGMASEFFRAPEDRGSRVPACRGGPPTANCAADTAGRFCRARGYAGGSAFQRIETVRGQDFLADVLCSRSG